MTVTVTRGDLLAQKVDAIVNTVNCVGVMGKGIALQFKRKWPPNFRAYEAACRKKIVVPGRMFVFDAGGLLKPRYIINFPTKVHWRGKSHIDIIRSGLEDLVRQIKELNIRSIAIPPLGCGNGGLDWSEVRPVIEEALSTIPDVEVRLFAPSSDDAVRELAAPETAPRMTLGRAAMIAVLAAYRELAYPLTRIEVQKLAYFLERAGEPLGLSFVRHTYGPYSDKLRHVLTAMDGSYITGVGDQAGRSEIRVVPDALISARATLEHSGSETLARVDRVADTIEGFQTPYGMELLATVHWVATEEPSPKSVDEVIERVHAWNERKRQLMSDRDIGVAWTRLAENQWL
jgi:O-acetyl-ADP-ribose deacetylase (regulator of RNase III)